LLVPRLPPALCKIIEQCLRKDPSRRFQHMGDVRLALEEVAPVRREALRGLPAFWRRALLYGALATLPMLGGWLLFSRYFESPAPSMPIPLTSFPGMEAEAAWSPDGRQVAFVWNGERQDNYDIYLLQPGSSQTLRLTTDPGADTSPAWSPDGRWIAYANAAADRGHYSLNLVSPLGGAAHTLLANAAVLGFPSWTPDGRTVVIEIAPEPKRPEELWAVSVDTGRRRQLTWPLAGSVGDLTPALSPDGKTLAFCRKTAYRTAELYLLDLRPNLSPAGTPRRITDFGYVAHPTWTPDGSRLLFDANREGAGIWQADRSGKRLRPVFGVPNTASQPAIAKRPGGYTSLIFTNSVAQRSIWRYSTAQGPGGPPVELAPSSRSQSHPRYSNDGSRLAFSSTRSGHAEIWVANAGGSQPVQLTDLRHPLTELGHWSPADDAIAFVSQDRGHRQIYVVGSSGGPAVPATNENGVGIGTGWSRDGSAYYYNSSHSGRLEVWKVSRGGGRPEPMTVNGGEAGFESTRGVFYYWRQKLMRRMPDGDREVSLDPPSSPQWLAVPVPEGFYYKAADTQDIYLYDENTGRSMRVLARPERPFNQFTMSPDGRWFASDFLGNTSVDLMIMEHFH
jgi:Tol biopolymer transport system component